ncbi:MAG TPA: PQQ-binding-like beta-propeller repeat protein [Fimbriiglobus sp.]
MARPLRRTAVLIGLVLILGIGGTVAYLRWATILGWFESERVNPVEVAELQSAVLPAASATDAAVGWPQWRGPNRDGVAPAGPFHTDWNTNPPQTLWSIPSGGGYSSLSVVAGRAYAFDFHDGQERLRCLDADTGKTIWEFAEPADYASMTLGYATGPRATPTVSDGKIFTVGAAGRFNCLELPTAGGEPKRLWSHDLAGEFGASIPTWGFACSPLIEGDLVVVQPGSRKGSVAAYDRKSGTLRWTAGNDPNGYSSPVAATLAGVRQVIAVTGKSVLGIRPADGTVLWKYSWVTQFDGNIATPIVVGDYVFVSASYGKGCALLHVEAAQDGAKITEVYFRKNRVMRNHHDTCVYRDGFLYGFDGDYLKCVNLRTGEAVAGWEADPFVTKGSVILVDKYLLGMTETGKLFLADADPKAFTLRGKMESLFAGKENWATPVLVDGRIYVRNHENVKCINVR